ncbi:MAG: formylmethanofuran dehydrogenase subunit B, partial [Planctomycetota bacterium]|nr:formylmethanofuran dehydrogenase subunit B [Planctomycetota bacterium]
AGADSVLCWQTGFPFSVNFSRGFPRHGPGEYSANEVLERREADCCLFVGSEGFEKLSASAQAHVRAIPTIVLDYPSETPAFSPKVRFTTAVYGIHQHGTAYRMDETPIPLNPVLPCGEGNTDADILDKILKQLENLDHLSHEIR